MMILTARAMEPDGPVAVADLYYRRNLWLLAFGVVNAVVLFWPGDILHIYALAALFIFPFRRLGPKDRKRGVWGKGVSARVDLGGSGIIKKKKHAERNFITNKEKSLSNEET